MLALLRTLPLVWQLAGGAAVLLAVGGGYALWHHHVYQTGYDKALLDVAADNQEAIDARNKAVSRVRSCRDAGRVWDTTTGECR